MGAKYAEAKRKIQKFFGGIFDDNALDSARFIYGVENTDEIIWHDGSMTIEDFIALEHDNRKIPQGERNSHMSHFAPAFLKRYGISEKAYELYYTEAAKCDPPLDEEELNTIWESALKFADKITKQPGYVKPEDYGESLRPEDFTDQAQAKVFARENSKILKYTKATEYLSFDGTYWQESNLGAEGAYMRFSDRQRKDVLNMLEKNKEKLEFDPDQIKKILPKISAGQRKVAEEYLKAVEYAKFVKSARMYGHITAVIKLARSILEISPENLDKDPYLLNFPDGTYDLRTGKRKDHDPKDYITKCTAFSPSDKGMELWLETLDTIFQGDPDLI